MSGRVAATVSTFGDDVTTDPIDYLTDDDRAWLERHGWRPDFVEQYFTPELLSEDPSPRYPALAVLGGWLAVLLTAVAVNGSAWAGLGTVAALATTAVFLRPTPPA